MPKYRITAETVIEIEAGSKEHAQEIFYDEVYYVDRHGVSQIEEATDDDKRGTNARAKITLD